MAIFLKVSPEESGQKLLNFLERQIDSSKNEIHKWIRKGDVRVNKKRADPFDRLEENDEIRLPPFAQLHTKNPTSKTRKIDYELDKIYEDKDLLVINKNHGLSVQGGTKQIISLVDILKDIYRNSSFMPTPAHRIDKETSGLVLIAKSYSMLRELHEAFSDKENTNLHKIYHAKTSKPHDIIDTITWKDFIYIEKDAHGFEKSLITNTSKDSKEAISHVKSLQSIENNLLEIELITGRKHQIRAQCAHRNIALLGDTKYNGKPADRLYLHAHKIIWQNEEFIAPIDW